MNHDFDCEVTASMLDSGRVLAVAGHVAALMAAIGILSTASLPQRSLFAAALILWPVACWFAVRVAIDASLFRAMAHDPETSARSLDAFLHKPSGRPLHDRCRGALRLWRLLIAAASVQILCVIAGLLLNL